MYTLFREKAQVQNPVFIFYEINILKKKKRNFTLHAQATYRK